jgi:aryl-alcohol dehydrogenase-like predicted oxidoreductase
MSNLRLLKNNFEICIKNFSIKKLVFSEISKDYFKWFENNQAKKFIVSKYKTKKELLDFIKKDIKKKNTLYFGIFHKRTNHIGNVKFHNINLKKKDSWLGIFIGNPKFRNLKVGRFSINLLTNYLYDKIGIRIFYLKVDKKNTPAIKSYRNSGFQIVKIFKKSFLMKMDILKNKIVLGTAQLGDPYGITNKKKLNKSAICSILDVCKKNISSIDTAEDYNISVNIKKKFKNFVVNSKISVDLLKKDKQELILYFNKIKKLYDIDVLFVRNLENEYYNKKVFRNLKILKRYKFIRRVGLSIYSFKNIKKTYQKLKYDAIQLPVNIFDNRGLKYKNFFKKNQIEVYARSVFLQGVMFLEKKNITIKEKFKDKNLNNFFYLKKKLKLNVYNYAISYVLNQKYIDKIIIGVHNVSQVKNVLNFSHIKNTKFLNKFNSNNLKLIDPRKW